MPSRDTTLALESRAMSPGVDPVTFSVLLHAIGEASSEMTTVLQHGARSTIISIARDHSASIYTAEAQMLYQNDALPIHTIGGGLNIEAIKEEFGDDINDGDIFMINDPYMGTTHNSDLTVIMPVFVDGEHLFWTAVRAHQNNTGEASFGYASTSVWQDGIQIPPVRIFERGREIRSTIRFYLRNVRLPDWLEADLRAMVGAVRAGAGRLQEMTETHGIDVVVPTLAEMINYAERRTAAEIRALPDGVYHGEGWIDSDGQGTHNIRIACTRSTTTRSTSTSRAATPRPAATATRPWPRWRPAAAFRCSPSSTPPSRATRDPRRLHGQRSPGRRPLQRDRGHDGGLRQHSGAHHHRPHHPAQRGMHAPHPGHGA